MPGITHAQIATTISAMPYAHSGFLRRVHLAPIRLPAAIPAQEADGFWHYNLSDNDPKDKDLLGYFMLTTQELMHVQKFNPAYREEKLNTALKKAQAFTLKFIAPMTDPNTGTCTSEYASIGTPKHYSLEANLKRSFQLGLVLIGAGHKEEGIKIVDAALDHFPYGNAGKMESSPLCHRLSYSPICDAAER